MALPLMGVRLRWRGDGDHAMGLSFMHDGRPPPAEGHSHVDSWLDPSGMIGVRDHEKDLRLEARRTVKWHEGLIHWA